jgi:hypothetical protein
MSEIIKRPVIKSVDFCVDENIWGHRLYDEQLPHLTVLEFLGVLGSNLDKPLRPHEGLGGAVQFKPQRQMRLRGLLFNNPYVESIAESKLPDEEKWRQWIDKFDQGKTGNGDTAGDIAYGLRDCAAAGARCTLAFLATVAAGFALGAAVEVVDLLGRECHAVDGFAVLLVVVVAQAADDVDVRALAQVLGGVLGLLAPQRPLDRGGFLLAAVAAAAPGVADRGQHALGNLAFAAVDEFELDGARQVRVTLEHLNVGHGHISLRERSAGPRTGLP